jgi:tRNA pseudouridine55 synthase
VRAVTHPSHEHVTDPRGGVLVVDKPAGLTSHDVVHIVRRAFGGMRVGHTGTLDPFATGVLALVLGRATRLAQFFSGADKEYLADIRLGSATDTYDATGTVTFTAAAPYRTPASAEIERVLAGLGGAQEQMPPPFSAKMAGGVRAYTRARQGLPVELHPASVVAYALDGIRIEGDTVRVHVHCSAGYYVRSLAHEVGRALGVGGHLLALQRVRSGAFGLAEANSLEDIIRHPEASLGRLQPLESLLPEIPAVYLTPEGALRIARGQTVGPGQMSFPAGDSIPLRVRLLGPDGQLLALADRHEGDVLHPSLVLV